MATTLADGNIITARLMFSIVNEVDVAMNVLHYRVKDLSGAPADTTTGLSAIGIAIRNKFAAPWAEAASDEVQFNGVSVTNIFPLPRSVTVTAVPEDPVLGDIDGQPLPLQNSATILKRTNLGGRAGYGRLFYAGLPEVAQIKGVLTATALGNLGNMVLNLGDTVDVAGAGWALVLEPVLKQGPDDNPSLITPIAFCQTASNVVRAQRRRQPGKGS